MRAVAPHRRRSIAASIAAGVLVAASVTTAYAYLSGGGGGAGGGATGTTTAVSLAPGTTGAALYPGGTAPVSLVATNPNASPVRIGSLALDTARGTAGFGVDSGHADCATGALTLAGSNNGGAGWTVPANGTLAISLPAALAASTALVSACQGATVTVYLVAS